MKEITEFQERIETKAVTIFFIIVSLLLSVLALGIFIGTVV